MTKKKLHILFLNSWYPSKVLPNNGDFIQRHSEAVALKHRVTSIHVITDENLTKNNVEESNLNGVKTLIAYLKPYNSKFAKHFYFYKAYKELIDLTGKYDMVHVNRLFPVGIIALGLKIFKSKPYIISEHFTGYLIPHSKDLSKIEMFLSKFITKQSNFVCPVSNNLAKNMINIGLDGNYFPIPNVVDTKMFFPQQKNKKPFTIVHISSLLNSHKNVTGILNVIKKLEDHIPDFLFYLIGENPNQYKNHIETLKINPNNIKLIDQIPHHQVAEYVQNSDVFLLFSNYENLPCVILEAFACGTKVIATDVGGTNEYFPKGFGFLIPSKNETELLNSLIKIEGEGQNLLKKEMHQYAKTNFSKETICDAFSKLYYKSLNIN